MNKSLARIYFAHSDRNVPDNYELMANMIDYCNHHRIRVILVSTPQTKEYNDCLSKRQIRSTQFLVQKLQQRYCFRYFDYREDVRFVDDDFYDQSHLSEIGALKFTKLLVNDIRI